MELSPIKFNYMNSYLTNISYFKKKERNSIVLLVVVILFSSFSDEAYFFLADRTKKEEPANLLDEDQIFSMDQGILESTAHLSISGNSFDEVVPEVHSIHEEISDPYKKMTPSSRTVRAPERLGQIPLTKEIIISAVIDPNNTSSEELIAAGISSFAANNWVKFSQKGAQFYGLEDLEKIYGLEKEELNTIASRIKFPKRAVKKKPSKLMAFDVNTASAEQFSKINGIGKVLSERIVRFRDKLGGFHDVKQIKEVYGVEDSIVVANLPFFKIDTEPIKININTATSSDLQIHPYCNYKIANIIVNYRAQHESFTSAKELLEIRLIDEVWLSKIQAYLEF